MKNTIIFIICFLIGYGLGEIIKSKSTVDQPEYNHKVTTHKVDVVSNTNEDTIHCIWFRDQIYTLDTMAMENL